MHVCAAEWAEVLAPNRKEAQAINIYYCYCYIAEQHILKCFTFLKMQEKLTQRFFEKLTAFFDRLQAYPLSPLDTKKE